MQILQLFLTLFKNSHILICTKEKTKVKKAAKLRIEGETLDTLNFTWESRRLTVQRFKMKPQKVPKKPQQPYDVTFSVLRGAQQSFKPTAERRYFVQDIKGVVQAVSARNDYAPRKINRIEKTLSVSIMIDHPEVNANIYRDVNKEMAKEIKRIYK